MLIPITLVFVAMLALLQIPMTIAVGLKRLHTGIRFMDGGDADLMQRMRAHGNFTETAPITLLAMGGAELAGTPASLIWAGGLILLGGRLIHYTTIRKVGWGNGRAIGMSMTFLALAGFAICILVAIIRNVV